MLRKHAEYKKHLYKNSKVDKKIEELVKKRILSIGVVDLSEKKKKTI